MPLASAREDAALKMPPLLTWLTGRQAVAGFVAAYLLTGPGIVRIVAFQDRACSGRSGCRRNSRHGPAQPESGS